MNADEKEAMRLEEQGIVKSLERSRQRLKTGMAELETWMAHPEKFERPPPANITQAAIDIHMDVMDLYRVRTWRRRFG